MLMIELGDILENVGFRYEGRRKVWVLTGSTKCGKVVSVLGDSLLDCVNQLGGLRK